MKSIKDVFCKYKKLILHLLLIFVIIGAIVCLISSFPRPRYKQTLRIGDKISGYRIMNHFYSYSYLTSIEEKDSIFEVTFLQYHNNNPYVFTYFIKDETCVDMFYSKIPSNKNLEMKLTIREDKRSIILEKCDIEKDKRKKSKAN